MPLQDSASLAQRLEGLEKEVEALKEAHAQETQRLAAELGRTQEVGAASALDQSLSRLCPRAVLCDLNSAVHKIPCMQSAESIH